MCEGYKKDFKWRAFEETTFTTKPIPSPKIKRSELFFGVCLKWLDLTLTGTTCIEAVIPNPGSPTASEASGSTISHGITFSQPGFQTPLPPMTPSDSRFPPQSYQHNMNNTSLDSHLHIPSRYALSQAHDNFQPISTPSTVNSIFDDGSTLHSAATAASSYTSGQSPRLIDLLLPGTDMKAPPSDYQSYKPQQSDVPYQPSAYPLEKVQKTNLDIDDDVEEIVRQSDPAEAWVMRLPSPSPSNSSSSSQDSRFNAFSPMCRQPKASPGSPEMLMMRFDLQTCGILSVKDGPTENPWRTMVWPLARDSPALYHAISSMTAFHTSKNKPQLRVEGMEHMRKSIQHLSKGIETMRTDAALATTLVLAFSDSWDQHISSGTEHLRGARILLDQALTKHRQSPLNVEDFERLKFLCNTWIYMDVIARLTSVDDDDSDFFSTVITPVYRPLGLNNEIDPLMGCASTLFPWIGRVANLVRKVRTSTTNSFSVISQAIDLKAALENWEPPLGFEAPEDPSSDIQHSLQTAESYRWATLLYLHQAVPEIPSQSAAELAKKALVYLATVPLASRTVIVQIYPLLAAGCEATSMDDRTWVENRWAAMIQRMLIGNVDRCREVVKEVWDRRDADEMEKLAQRHRRTASKLQTGYMYPGSEKAKRKFRAEEDDHTPWLGLNDDLGTAKRRATGDGMNLNEDTSNLGFLPRKKSIDMLEEIDFEKTVRGRLHWIGVMRDWSWEGEI